MSGRIQIWCVAALLVMPAVGLAQAPQAVDYVLAGGKRVQLTEVKDAGFYRIQGTSKLSKDPAIRDALSRNLGMMSVRSGPEEFAVRRSQAGAGAARAAISRLTRTQEAAELRVFTTDGGRTLLVEYPEVILQCDEKTTLAEVRTYLSKHYQVTVEPTGLSPGQFLIKVLTPSHALWLANQLQSTRAIPVRMAEVNFWAAVPSGGSAPAFPDRWPAAAGPGLPNDPAYAEQWALENRASRPNGLKDADTGYGRAYRIAPPDGSGVKVAVLDYAIDVHHPELEGAVDSVFNATRYDNLKGLSDPALKVLDYVTTPETEADHGTACAGIIAALTSNRLGISGVAAGAKIVAVQIATPGPEDVKVVSGLTILAALQAAERAGAQVISLSWGLRLPNQEGFGTVRAAIENLNRARQNRGVLVVSAAGNDTVSVPAADFPADYSEQVPNLIAAGASNWCGEAKTRSSCDKEPWSSRFNGNTLFAPGVGIFTITNTRNKTTPDALNNYRTNFNGTSAATPFIAAAAALVMKQHPDWPAGRVRDHLINTAGKLKGAGKPVVDICNALHGAERCRSN